MLQVGTSTQTMALDSERPTIELTPCEFLIVVVSLGLIFLSWSFLKKQQALHDAQLACDRPLEENLAKLLEEALSCKDD